MTTAATLPQDPPDSSLLADDLQTQDGLVNQRTRELREGISRTQAAERALLTSNERFRQIFDNMSSGIAILEAVDEGADFIVRAFNPSAKRATKLQQSDVLDRRVSQALPGMRECGLFEALRRLWRTEIPERHPATLYRAKALTFWAENYFFKLPSGEIVWMFDDVTERKEAEQAARDTGHYVPHWLKICPKTSSGRIWPGVSPSLTDGSVSRWADL